VTHAHRFTFPRRAESGQENAGARFLSGSSRGRETGLR
jgi:hypothetical protein